MDVKKEDVFPDDNIIAVMGPTGSGKSTFVDIATNHQSKEIGHRLESRTSAIRAVRFALPESNYSFVLVDTPGFDDTYKSDMEILSMIADWLEKTYRRHILLAGIIYLHRIFDNRMTGSSLRNLRMFAKLCGEEAIGNVVLVTTMWDSLKDQAVGERRQAELSKTYWKPMLEHGSKCMRFQRTYESARTIIDSIITRNSAHSLLVQEEMVDLHRRLSETEAGIALYGTLQNLLADRQEAIRRLREQAKAEHNDQLVQELTAQIEIIQDGIQDIFDQVTKMKIPFGRRIRLMFSFKKPHSRGVEIPA